MSSSPVVVAAASESEKPVRRVTKRGKAAVPEVVAAPAPVVPEVAAAAPKKRKAAAPKAKASEKAVEAVAAAVEADKPAAAATESKENTKRARAPKVHRTFITAYGDLAVDKKARDFSKVAFNDWKAKTKEALESMTYKEWERAKREFYRAIEKLQKKKKRTAKGYNWEATAENHLRRLKEMPKEEFAELDGVWLSNYQFSGSYDKDVLAKDGCPEKGAIPTYTVWLAAVHHGFKPLGIVSENGTRTGNELAFTTPVDGKRVYVGVALPFQNKERSKFSVVLKDRVANDL